MKKGTFLNPSPIALQDKPTSIISQREFEQPSLNPACTGSVMLCSFLGSYVELTSFAAYSWLDSKSGK